MRNSRTREKGSTMVEFALAGVPAIFLMITALQMSLGMWAYHTLSYAAREGTRYAATKGPGCSYPGNSCSVTVADVARLVANASYGLQTSSLEVTLASDNGTITCNPVSNCYTSTTVWPPQSLTVGSYITVSAYYPMQVLCLPFGASLMMSSANLGASSRHPLTF
jgi:Flp pilus assembly protein TadG